MTAYIDAFHVALDPMLTPTVKSPHTNKLLSNTIILTNVHQQNILVNNIFCSSSSDLLSNFLPVSFDLVHFFVSSDNCFSNLSLCPCDCDIRCGQCLLFEHYHFILHCFLSFSFSRFTHIASICFLILFSNFLQRIPLWYSWLISWLIPYCNWFPNSFSSLSKRFSSEDGGHMAVCYANDILVDISIKKTKNPSISCKCFLKISMLLA